MAMREIIEIDESKCTGCGDCETGCPEGALRIIDGKARLVGESLCDGLGACVGNCPFGAITVTRREAEPYEEAKVMEGIAKLGPKVVAAHLEHLRHHGQDAYEREGLAWLAAHGLEDPRPAAPKAEREGCGGGCPGSASRRFAPVHAPARAASTPSVAAAAPSAGPAPAEAPSALTHWPIQLHLVNPRAPQFAGADLLVAADCTAFALGSFHAGLLAGRSLVIACPKLDQGREIYVDKLAVLLEGAASVTIAIMEVPCCSGLLKLLLEARERSARKPPIDAVVLGIEGGVKRRSSY